MLILPTSTGSTLVVPPCQGFILHVNRYTVQASTSHDHDHELDNSPMNQIVHSPVKKIANETDHLHIDEKKIHVKRSQKKRTLEDRFSKCDFRCQGWY